MKMWIRLGIFLLFSSVAQLGHAQEFTLDFRNQKVDGKNLHLEGPDAASYIKLEDEGLRWRFTGGKSPTKPVGVRWNTKVAGDFTVTAHYEILQADRPERGIGVGVELYVVFNTPTLPRDAIAFARLMSRTAGPVLTLNYMTNNEEGKRIAKDPIRKPTTTRSKTGKLRVTRQGTMVTMLAAEGDGDFTLVGPPRDIGEMEVLMVRVSGVDGGDPNAELDMRLLEFSLERRALGVGKTPPASERPAPAAPVAPNDVIPDAGGSRRALWVVLLGGVLTLAMFFGVGVLVWWKRSREKSPAQPPDVTSTRESSTTLTCATCGKRMRIKSGLAGKNVKCAACGNVTRAPEAADQA